MYDISNLDIGDIFYNVDEILFFTENKIVDKKNNLIYVHRKDLSGKYENLEKEEFYGPEEEEYCFKTKEEAELVYRENVNNIKQELKNIKTLLNRLYIRAFTCENIEAEIYKEAINNYINLIQES